MIGQGKTAGAGEMRVKSLCLRLASHLPQNPAPPQSWELPAAGLEGWQPNTATLSMAPFLQAFDTHMCGTDKNWRSAAPLEQFLGAADPQKKHANTGYWGLTEHATLRKLIKARGGAVTQNTQPDRLLPAPHHRMAEPPYLA
jgi:hypothetical protein